MALISDPEFIVLDEPMNGSLIGGNHAYAGADQKAERRKGHHILHIEPHSCGVGQSHSKYGFLSHGRLLKEISAEELRVSQEYIKLSFGRPVDKEIKEAPVRLDYEILRERSVIIRGRSDINRLLKIFIDAGIVVSNVEVVSKGIEDYWLEIIGGKHA